MNDRLTLFKGKDPTAAEVYACYCKGDGFKRAINLYDTVRVNENFYIGKQWEGIEANGLPTPQFNFLKRVVGFVVATITTDNIRVTASALSNTVDTGALVEPARIVNEEFEALTEQNRVPNRIRMFARDAAVRSDGCLYSYWDEDAETGQPNAKGAIRTELVENTRVFFGNPNDRSVQAQPWIMIEKREITREVKRRAKENGAENWQAIDSDSEEYEVDTAKKQDCDTTSVFLLMWRDEDSGEIRAIESTKECIVKKAWNMRLQLYPIVWLNWDYVADSYHGQAMLTGLVPNQIFVNRIWALSMLSFMKTAYPKYIFDKTKIARLDNRVGAAIGINGGDVNNAIKVIDPATISPQISQFIELAITQTEETLGATSVALGDTRPDNTSAIIALQRAASTPTELTKQNLYDCVEDLFRIYLDFMANYYGTRVVDMPTPDKVRQAAEFAGMAAPDEIPQSFDFGTLKKHPMLLKLDVGASSYYSEIASMQTLDQLLQNGHITIEQYLERIPDGYIPGRRKLLTEIKARNQQMAQAAPAATPAGGGQTPVLDTGVKPDIPTGGGFGALQRKVLEQGTTEGLV